MSTFITPSIRLKHYDYSQPGGYFVTICVKSRRCTFGCIENQRMCLNEIGAIIVDNWVQLMKYFSNISLDEFVVMPNHFHGIIFINYVFTDNQTSLGEIIRNFKARSTYQIRQHSMHDFAWQANYYETVIRGYKSLDVFREYIVNNPLKWALDTENPANF